MIAALIEQLIPWAIGVIALLVAVFVKTKRDVAKGRKEERRIQKEVDRETASNIRKRVNAAERLRDDQLKYRD